MKLVDILARELKEWPEGAASAVQDFDGEVKFSNSCAEPRIDFPEKVWIRSPDAGGESWSICGQVADDYKRAIVTRAEWQAAVDALNEPAAPEWDGSKVPPVGHECEFSTSKDGISGSARGFEPVRIQYVSDVTLVVLRLEPKDGIEKEIICHPGTAKFRPLPTPEQIAAREREEAARDLYSTINWQAAVPDWANQTESRKNDYLRAIDAGYRKASPPSP